MSKVNESTGELAENAFQKGQQFDAFLAEYEALLSEIRALEREIHELSMYAFVSIAGLATIVVALMNSKHAEILPVLLLILPLPFTAILFIFVSHLNRITDLGKYVHNHIEPGVNNLIRSSSKSLHFSHILQWENLLSARTKIDRWLTDGLWAGGQAVLILLPLIVSLAAYYFVLAEKQLAVKSWWVALLVFDYILLAVALFVAIVSILKRGLIGKKKRRS
jgi:Fe2+ transport system protein B